MVIPAARRDAAKADRRAHHTRRWRFMIESALLKYRKPMIELGFWKPSGNNLSKDYGTYLRMYYIHYTTYYVQKTTPVLIPTHRGRITPEVTFQFFSNVWFHASFWKLVKSYKNVTSQNILICPTLEKMSWKKNQSKYWRILHIMVIFTSIVAKHMYLLDLVFTFVELNFEIIAVRYNNRTNNCDAVFTYLRN